MKNSQRSKIRNREFQKSWKNCQIDSKMKKSNVNNFWLLANFFQVDPHGVTKRLSNMPNKNKRKGNCFLCGKHNVSLCHHCSEVHTCKLHFLSHRQNDYCFPFKIGDDQNSLVASRDIQPLELILFERPLALGPKYYDTTQKVRKYSWFFTKIRLTFFLAMCWVSEKCQKWNLQPLWTLNL